MQALALDNLPDVVQAGDVVGIGGMTLYRRPVALARWLASRAAREITVVGWTLGYETELLVEAGCVSRVRTSYVGLEVLGDAPTVRRQVEAGRIERPVECESSIALGVLAAALRAQGLSVGGGLGTTDFPTMCRGARVNADETVWLPAIPIDVALIHVEAVDRWGNGYARGQAGLDRILAAIATTTIVSAERILDRPPDTVAAIPASTVDYVVEVAGGAWPTSCWPHYSTDFEFLLERVQGAADRPHEVTDLERVRLS